MVDLGFFVEGAEALPHAVTPTIALKLRVASARDIHSVLLRCQIQIEAPKRSYNESEKRGLHDLFDDPSRWGRTLRGLLWCHVTTIVPAFSESVLVDLEVPCTFDFNAAVAKYFHALESGEVPLCLLFSGTVFHADAERGLQALPISWNKEARFRLPVAVWKEMMDRYYPNSAWLCLQRDAFDRLLQYKSRHGLATWELAIERLLSGETA